MSLKKLFVIPAAVTLALGVVNTASAGDVVSACKVVNERDHWAFGSKCGARGDLRWILGAGGLGTGAATGAAVGTIFGPLGTLGGLVAGGYVGGRLGGRMARHYNADEYIYFDNGDCIECDKHQMGEDWECPQGTIVTNGAEVYKCNVGSFNDKWEKIDLHVCGDSPVQESALRRDARYRSYIKDAVTQNGIELKPGVRKYSGAACIWIEEVPQQQNQNTDPTNVNNNNNASVGGININVLINSCVSQENGSNCNNMNSQSQTDCAQDPRFRGNADLIACCMHEKAGLTTMSEGVACSCRAAGYTWSTTEHTCVKGSGSNGGGSCEGYRSHPERYACCKAGQDTYWEGDLVNGRCICGAPRGANARQPNGKVWTWNGGTTGYCADPTNPVDPVIPVDPNPQPEYIVCNYTFTAKVRCKDGTQLDAMTNKTFTFAKGGSVIKGADGACQAVGMIDIAMMLKNQFCQSHQGLYDGPDDAAVEAAKSSLQSFFQTAQSTASVWKNEEDKFNTARLASDATAGVVLGTVGGIVSAKVIKKKQLEKGYDALNCTIGGQKVADWGDEFQVGYSR